MSTPSLPLRRLGIVIIVTAGCIAAIWMILINVNLQESSKQESKLCPLSVQRVNGIFRLKEKYPLKITTSKIRQFFHKKNASKICILAFTSILFVTALCLSVESFIAQYSGLSGAYEIAFTGSSFGSRLARSLQNLKGSLYLLGGIVVITIGILIFSRDVKAPRNNSGPDFNDRWEFLDLPESVGTIIIDFKSVFPYCAFEYSTPRLRCPEQVNPFYSQMVEFFDFTSKLQVLFLPYDELNSELQERMQETVGNLNTDSVFDALERSLSDLPILAVMALKNEKVELAVRQGYFTIVCKSPSTGDIQVHGLETSTASHSSVTHWNVAKGDYFEVLPTTFLTDSYEEFITSDVCYLCYYG